MVVEPLAEAPAATKKEALRRRPLKAVTERRARFSYEGLLELFNLFRQIAVKCLGPLTAMVRLLLPSPVSRTRAAGKILLRTLISILFHFAQPR